MKKALQTSLHCSTADVCFDLLILKQNIVLVLVVGSIKTTKYKSKCTIITEENFPTLVRNILYGKEFARRKITKKRGGINLFTIWIHLFFKKLSNRWTVYRYERFTSFSPDASYYNISQYYIAYRIRFFFITCMQFSVTRKLQVYYLFVWRLNFLVRKSFGRKIAPCMHAAKEYINPDILNLFYDAALIMNILLPSSLVFLTKFGCFSAMPIKHFYDTH